MVKVNIIPPKAQLEKTWQGLINISRHIMHEYRPELESYTDVNQSRLGGALYKARTENQFC